MIVATVKVKNAVGSLYQPGARMSAKPKGDKSSHEQWEENHWKERAHWTLDGELEIPGISFKKALEEAAKYNPTKQTGKGQKTFSEKFESGVIVMNGITVHGVTQQSVESTTLFVPSDGKKSTSRGASSKRVDRIFPTVKTWGGTLDIRILDDGITEQVFTQACKDAGLYIGVGTWRPGRGGMNGRFEAEVVSFVQQ